MSKILGVSNEPGKYVFQCPGCESSHWFNVDPSKSPCWTYNGDPDKPTVRASILVQGHLGANNYGTCHSFVTDGRIQYLNDCTHSLAGQTIEIPDWDKK